MADLVVRILVVAAVVAAALLAAVVLPRLADRRSARRGVDLNGVDGDLVLFTAPGCDTCDRARDTLGRVGVPFTEIAHDVDPDAFEAAGVDAVPTLAARNRRGGVAGVVRGAPSERQVRRLMRAGRITKSS